MRLAVILSIALMGAHAASAQESNAQSPRKIHLFIALCDNASQGIQPVGERIGNGDDPDNNLYWGCNDGAGKVFPRSKFWKPMELQKNPSETLLRRAMHRHKSTGALLLVDAYRGSSIKQCLTDFLRASEGKFAPALAIAGEKRHEQFGAEADLIAYIGHNGLMEFHIARQVPNPPADGKPLRDAMVLACVSDRYFGERLKRSATRPVLMTSQLMYPGAFLLHDALEGWLRGESTAKIRDRAAQAYVRNQKISFKAARGIFTDLDAPRPKRKADNGRLRLPRNDAILREQEKPPQ